MNKNQKPLQLKSTDGTCKATNKRWQVISKKTGKVVKRAETREEARSWKRSSNSPQSYNIMDGVNNIIVR